ncbi:MAG: TetR/AcrR family transcriptional regulator [Anaerolineae bacterium]
MSRPEMPSRPRKYHHGDLRNALIQAGLALLNESGSHTLDLRAVARRAGVSHVASYRHFADKNALLAAIAQEGFVQLAEWLQTAINQADVDIEAQLIAAARAYVDFALAQPSLMREMFSGLAPRRDDYPSLHDAAKRCATLITAIFERAQSSGLLPDGDAWVYGRQGWSTIHGLAMLLLEGQLHHILDQPNGAEQEVTMLIRTLWRGMRNR